jgi:hypothetical protein
LSKYGVATFGSTELTGLDIEDYTNVVHLTQRARSNSDDFPANCFVLEDLGIDGFLILADTEGKVFEWNGRNATEIYDSIEDYLKEITS